MANVGHATAAETIMSKKTYAAVETKEKAMMSKGFVATFALIVLAMSLPARADIIVDQSRISVWSPEAPSLDPVILPGTKGWPGRS